ncbi:hypothetical protein K435DRAFT_801391 [Dendrothele bispora CBS 962.96]|uniref:Uncharacterized protein n=1 Tax=Dendrothele bispora (strain CBS 962.96) TaxID=1314807 RepID=A0A4S8LQN4_DENBC|nr:hypothetical protein K435DRAFT_801391 [Dendrothele bispora CBS 962.96]
MTDITSENTTPPVTPAKASKVCLYEGPRKVVRRDERSKMAMNDFSDSGDINGNKFGMRRDRNVVGCRLKEYSMRRKPTPPSKMNWNFFFPLGEVEEPGTASYRGAKEREQSRVRKAPAKVRMSDASRPEEESTGERERGQV